MNCRAPQVTLGRPDVNRLAYGSLGDPSRTASRLGRDRRPLRPPRHRSTSSCSRWPPASSRLRSATTPEPNGPGDPYAAAPPMPCRVAPRTAARGRAATIPGPPGARSALIHPGTTAVRACGEWYGLPSRSPCSRSQRLRSSPLVAASKRRPTNRLRTASPWLAFRQPCPYGVTDIGH
jgi:hypothetical protein